MFTSNALILSSRRARCQAAFTIMEIGFAIALFGAFAVVSILAFSSFNRYASNARYESLALAVAQQKMDQVMTSPCSINPTNSALGPTITMTGTTVQPNSSNVYPSVVESGSIMTLNYDKWNMSRTITLGGQSNVPLTGTLSGTTVAGAEDTQVIDTRTTTFTKVTGNVRLINVTVSVAYTYRSRSFTVSLNSLRTSDNF